jgi:hypothetical protein
MNFNFDSNKIILFPFPSYAGGKFLMNCLALSRNAVFSHADIALQDLFLKDNNRANYYEWKLETAIKSLPITEDKIKNWRINEIYGAIPLFRVDWDHTEVLTHLLNINTSNIVKILSNRNDTNFFLESHEIEKTIKYKKIYKNAKILIINDYIKFIEIAYNKKTENGNFRKDKHILKSISTFERDKAQLNVDFCISYENIFQEELFLEELQNLYYQLGYDDFNKELVKIFYRKYISLHL